MITLRAASKTARRRRPPSPAPDTPKSNHVSASETIGGGSFSGKPMNEKQFAELLGHAALKVWADLPRDAQERLFAAVDDGLIANSLAEFLHDLHPKTAHPPKPTCLA